MTDQSLSSLLPVDAERKEAIAAIIRDRGIHYAKSGVRITAPNGNSQTWLVDMRPVMLHSATINMIADLFWDEYASKMPFQLGGMEVAAIPLLAALMLKAEQRGIHVSGFYVRKERKNYGLGRQIEGSVTDEPVIVVDDSINSGDSIEKVRIVLQQAGKKVAGVFTIMDFRSKKGVEWRKKHNIPLTSIFTLNDFELKMQGPGDPLRRAYKPLWEFVAFGGDPYYLNPKSTPLLHEDRLYFGAESAIFYCVDATNGRPVWEFPVKGAPRKGIWSSPRLHAGKLYFGAYNGTMYCLDTATGALIWDNPACEWIGSTPCILPHHNLLVVGLEYARPDAQGSMAAFDLVTGEKKWEVWLQVMQHGSGSYWAPDDTVIVGTNDHTVVSYKAATGEQVWSYTTDRSIKYPMAIDHQSGLVVGASFDGGIYALDAHSGELRGRIQTDNLCYTTPLITHGKIFCGSGDRNFYIIDVQTMQVLKKTNYGAKIFGSPVVHGDSVIFGAHSGVVREIDANTLKMVGWLQVPDAVTNAVSLSPDGKRLFVPTAMSEIYAFERFITT